MDTLRHVSENNTITPQNLNSARPTIAPRVKIEISKSDSIWVLGHGTIETPFESSIKSKNYEIHTLRILERLAIEAGSDVIFKVGDKTLRFVPVRNDKEISTEIQILKLSKPHSEAVRETFCSYEEMDNSDRSFVDGIQRSMNS